MPWNKGLTKKDHPSIARIGFQLGHKGYTYWKGKNIPLKTVEALRLSAKSRTPYIRTLKCGATYSAFHKWLSRRFGKASKCEFDCANPSHVFDYALIKGKKHEHRRENYMQLCRRCHLSHDRN